MQSFTCFFGSAAAFLVAANVAFADNCSGRYTGVTVSADTHEVAKGHSVTFFTQRGSTVSDNSPFNAVGECGGYTLTMPDGKTMTSGICTRKGNNGDSESDVWSIEPGAERGTWKQVAGTGAMACKSCSGWFEAMVDDGKESMGKWGGDCR